jgi:hypothetical protein
VLTAVVFKGIALHFRIAIVRVWIEAGLQLSELDREMGTLRAKNGSRLSATIWLGLAHKSKTPYAIENSFSDPRYTNNT